ncbi:cytochrome c family protein [Salinigranum halophilum]|uniref:hypothetical protein n=1 Tax=Salinigranum halophilum TaxID=2565931 RepID=UPI00115F35F0|nr:hypothetical protein [Salinigranum halophilum]
MRRIAILSVVALALFSGISVSPALAQDSLSCNAQENSEICITEFNITQNVIKRGSNVEGVLEVKNIGNATGEAVILVATDRPDAMTKYQEYKQFSLDAGQTREIPLAFTTGESSLGEHRVNVLVLDEDSNHLYDATGYSQSVIIKKDPLTLSEIAEFIQTTRALWVLVTGVLTFLAFLIGKGGSRR